MTPDQIKEIRVSKDWTQQELASRLGLTQATVSRLEAGEIIAKGATRVLLEQFMHRVPAQ